MVPKICQKPVACGLVTIMFVGAAGELGKGNIAELIPSSIQLAIGNATSTISSTAGVLGDTGVIGWHPNAISDVEYASAAHTDALPLDGLTFPQSGVTLKSS